MDRWICGHGTIRNCVRMQLARGKGHLGAKVPNRNKRILSSHENSISVAVIVSALPIKYANGAVCLRSL